MPLKMLHGKGLIIIAFVLYIENVATVNAVSLWSQSKNGSSPNNNNRNYGNKWFASAASITSSTECDASVHSCPSRYSRTPGRSGMTKRRNRAPVAVEDCCVQCTNCMDSKQLNNLCDDPLLNVRGGDLGVESSTLETGAAVLGAVTPYNISLNAWKIIFQIILTSINVIFWLVPLKNKNFSENKLGLSLANAFSGGVFLSLAFGHFMPECIHGFEGYNEALPFMIVLGGYLLIFFVEKVAFETDSLLDTTSDSNGQSSADSTSSNNSRGAVILLGALAVHSILEMTALGLANNFSDAAVLTLSIALHQVRSQIVFSFVSCFLYIFSQLQFIFVHFTILFT